MRELTKDFKVPIDLRTLLSDRDVEFLEVNESNLVVIYDGEVVQMTITDGSAGRVRTIQCRVQETPRSSTEDWEAYIERLDTLLVESAGNHD